MSEQTKPTFEGNHTFGRKQPFRLAAGGRLQPVTVHYAAYGSLNARRDNAILVCHALSGSARVADWWPEFVGPDRLFDTNRYFVVGSNVIGSCYGSTGPASTRPRTGEPYGPDFPLVTISDMVRAQAELVSHLGIDRLHMVAGGSIGGMQALQWAVDFPDRSRHAVAIGAAPLPPMGLALNHLQREAIRLDPDWNSGRYEGRGPRGGLAIARGLAMCSYKSATLFDERFGRAPNRSGEDPHASVRGRFDIAGYLDYQGRMFLERFDANSYLTLSKAMDTFAFDRQYGSNEAAFRRIRSRVHLVGISSDWLFPPASIENLAEQMHAADVDVRYSLFESDHGHDAFLAEAGRLAGQLGSLASARFAACA